MNSKEFKNYERYDNKEPKNNRKIVIIVTVTVLIVSVIVIGALLLSKIIGKETTDNVKGNAITQAQELKGDKPNATVQDFDILPSSKERTVRGGIKAVYLNDIAIFVEHDRDEFKTNLVLYDVETEKERIIYSKERSFNSDDITNLLFDGEYVVFDESLYQIKDSNVEYSGSEIMMCNIKTNEAKAVGIDDEITPVVEVNYFDNEAVYYQSRSEDSGWTVCKYDLKTGNSEVILKENIGSRVLYNETIFYALENPEQSGPASEPYITYVYNFKTGEKIKIADIAIPIYIDKNVLGYITEENGNYTLYTCKPDGSEKKVASSLDEIDGKYLNYYDTAFDGRYLYSYINGDGLYVLDTETSSCKRFANSKFEQYTFELYMNTKSDGKVDVYAVYGDNLDEEKYMLDYVFIALDGLNEPKRVLAKSTGEFWDDDDLMYFVATDKGMLFAQTYENSSTGFEFVPFE